MTIEWPYRCLIVVYWFIEKEQCTLINIGVNMPVLAKKEAKYARGYRAEHGNNKRRSFISSPRPDTEAPSRIQTNRKKV